VQAYAGRDPGIMICVEYGLLLLRLVVGLLFAGHGAQKLFGWFGGGGPQGTAGFFASLGYRMPAVMAVVAGLSEFGGGLLLAAGFLTPLASLLLATVMLNAIATVKWRDGFLGGYEFEFTLLTVAIALAVTGPGRISLDDAIGWADDITGTAWGSLTLAAAIVVSLVTTTLGRARADLDEIPG
jgi:putative oxidoreductase